MITILHDINSLFDLYKTVKVYLDHLTFLNYEPELQILQNALLPLILEVWVNHKGYNLLVSNEITS